MIVKEKIYYFQQLKVDLKSHNIVYTLTILLNAT
jgi:hypothetical protein